MSTEERTNQDLPELHISHEGRRCGNPVGRDGDRTLYCDLPEGHAETACSAPIENVTSPPATETQRG